MNSGPKARACSCGLLTYARRGPFGVRWVHLQSQKAQHDRILAARASRDALREFTGVVVDELSGAPPPVAAAGSESDPDGPESCPQPAKDGSDSGLG